MPTERAADNKHFPHCLFMSKTTQDAKRQISTRSSKIPTMFSKKIGSSVNESTNPNRQMNNKMGRTHQNFRI